MVGSSSSGGMSPSPPLRDLALLAARMILGGVFIAASIDKIADPAGFAGAIGNYRILPLTPALVVATVLPWLELLCGLGLVFGLRVRASALLILLMLIIFTAGVGSALLRGLDISCGCFTRDPSAGRIGWTKLVENGILIILSALLYIVRGSRWSMDTSVARSEPH